LLGLTVFREPYSEREHRYLAQAINCLSVPTL
jgi:hypothetical protein